MKSLLCVCVCFFVCAVGVAGLSCVRDLTCTKLQAVLMYCRFGVVSGPCKACQCAKGPGDECGGLFNLSGICGKGLYCKMGWHLLGVGTCIPGCIHEV
ncbi:neuroparsin-A-like [Penaeus japonicus]|uniref:neuroparsin-A-like n=1 Tax=Penaeus japonicus TaxID=27405 RepID=UPI001C70FB37|nr:neuroparsin-A-like [Penaeus japonicus]